MSRVFFFEVDQVLDFVRIATQQSPAMLDLCLRETQSEKSQDYRDTIVFLKLRFQIVLRPHEK